MTAGVRLGVDFGTSSTKVALKLPERAPFPLDVGEQNGTAFMPSVVTFLPNGRGAADVRVGEEALRTAEGGTTIRSVKRCLGCAGERCTSAKRELNPWCVGDGSIQVTPDHIMMPEEISSLIVKEALQRAEEAAHRYVRFDDVEGVTFTCGASFNHDQRSMIESIARSHFPKITIDIVDEPVAAAMAYANLSGIPDGRTLIYDFGGGTFDTAYLDIALGSRGQVTLISADGVPWLGGDDVDRMVYDLFVRSIGDELGMDAEEITGSMSRREIDEIRRISLAAKEGLSVAETYENAVFERGLGIETLRLSRADLEQLVLADRRFDGFDLAARSMECVLNTVRFVEILRDARTARLVDTEALRRVTKESLGQWADHVIPVGGLTRMPLIGGILRSLFGAERIANRFSWDETICAVAMGAAYPPLRDQFSILRPPCTIKLVLSSADGNVQETRVLHHAGDKLDFLGGFPSLALPVFRTPQRHIVQAYPRASLVFESGGRVMDQIDVLGLASGNHYATIDMAGRLKLDATVTPERYDAVLPQRHPWQVEIEEEDTRRLEWEQEVLRYKQTQAANTIFTEK